MYLMTDCVVMNKFGICSKEFYMNKLIGLSLESDILRK